MKSIRLLYLLCLLGPVAFLFGFIAGAPRTTAEVALPAAVDARHLPVSAIDYSEHEGNLATPDNDWLQPNEGAREPELVKRR